MSIDARMKTLLTASHVVPMSSPMVRDGGVVFENGRIIDVGPATTLAPSHPDADVRDLGDAVILPGLVNAHVHLELTRVKQLPPPASFIEWIMALYGATEIHSFADWKRELRQGVLDGVGQCFACGVTTVGDVSRDNGWSRPALAETPIRAISFGEVLGMAGRISQLDMRIDNALDTTFVSEKQKIGLEPHAPYSLDLTGYRRCVELAKQKNLPITTHLAETSDENEFLANHSGPFRKLWEFMGSWDNTVSKHAGGVVSAMNAVGLLDLPAALAHVNYVSDAELAILAKSPASVVYCPRTHAYFGHRPHRFREMLAMGINVAIGTDSTASSPDLNLLADVRVVRGLAPSMSGHELLEMVTTRAARALGMGGEVGAIEKGYWADLAVFDVAAGDVLMGVIDAGKAREVWVAGEKVGDDA